MWCWPWRLSWSWRRFGVRTADHARRAPLPRTQQKYVCHRRGHRAPYWIDSKAGLMDKARELGVTATFTGPPPWT